MVNFKDELVEKLKGKNLSESSIKLYIRNLEKLNGGELKDFKFLKNVDTVLDLLKAYKDNTKRSILISIVSILGCCPDDKKIVKLKQKYYDLMLKKNDEIKEKTTDEATEEQKENWISWDDVKKRFDELKKEVEESTNNTVVLSKPAFETLLYYMILALYIHNQPRRNKDYQYMNIVFKSNDKLPKDRNYLSYSDNKFIFNVYKTSKKYGQKVEDISEDLKKCIDLYLKFHPKIKGKVKKNTDTPFLVGYDGNPLSQVNSMTKIFNKIFNKKISSSALRHIFLSDKYGDVVKEMKEDADKMGHSVQQQKEYIKNVI
jgi:hypothetical protein